MKLLLASSVLPGILLFATGAEAREFDMFVCQDCSFNEAREFAIQRGAPQITCQPGLGQVVIDPDNQQCFSGANDYLVVNISTKTLYAFTLTHSNQGGQPWLMTVNVSTFTPTKELHSLAIDAVNFREYVYDTLEAISDEMSRTFTTPADIDNYFLTGPASQFNNQFTSRASCENDPGYRAARMAFGAQFLQDVQVTVDNMYQRALQAGIEGDFFDGFSTTRLTSAGLQVGRDSLGVNGSWEYIRSSRRINYDLGWSGVGDPYENGANKIVVDFFIEEGATTLRSSLNRQASLIGGVTIANLEPDNGTLDFPLVHNECIAEALSQSLSMVMTNSSGGVIGGSGWNDNAPPGGGGMPIPGGGSSWNTSSPALCRMHFYRNYERVATILVPCP